MDAALALQDRFGETTQWSRVAPALAGTIVTGLVLYTQFGLSAALPVVFVLLALLGEALYATLAVLAVLSFAVIRDAGWAFDFGAGAQVLLEMLQITQSPVLLAIPLFTLAGAIMTAGGISARLVRVMRAGLGWMPGGVALSTILACAVFAALSGSSAVTIIAIGGFLAPALEKDYGKPFSLGLLTSCGAIGILAPPSLPLIIYGVVSGADINKLFVAGVVPALLTIGVLGLYSAIRGVKLPRQPFDRAEFGGFIHEFEHTLVAGLVTKMQIFAS